MLKLLRLILLYLVVDEIYSLTDCSASNYFLRYYKIKSCHKSVAPLKAWINTINVNACMKFARSKRAFAFNYSPVEGRNYSRGYFKNCQIFDCPETGNSTLSSHLAFDYYSAFGNLTTLENSTCIRSTGMFGLIPSKQNYTESILACQKIGADLANVLSEHRTNFLAKLLNNQLKNWYKAAYIGLDSLQVDNQFETSEGFHLSCSQFRAWAPGQPRPHRKCVILDAERSWKTVHCSQKLAALCEFYPEKPVNLNFGLRNVTCQSIKDRGEKRRCTKEQQLYQLYKNSSRIDQCALADF